MIIDDKKSSQHKSEPRSPRVTFDGARQSLSNESTQSDFVGLRGFGASSEYGEIAEANLPMYSPGGRMLPHTAASSCECF